MAPTLLPEIQNTTDYPFPTDHDELSLMMWCHWIMLFLLIVCICWFVSKISTILVRMLRALACCAEPSEPLLGRRNANSAATPRVVTYQNQVRHSTTDRSAPEVPRSVRETQNANNLQVDLPNTLYLGPTTISGISNKFNNFADKTQHGTFEQISFTDPTQTKKPKEIQIGSESFPELFYI